MDKKQEQIADARLDELLMQVSVPDDLKDELLKIPLDESEFGNANSMIRLNQSDAGSSKRKSRSTKSLSRFQWDLWRQRSAIVVAACYLFLAVSIVVFWPGSSPTLTEQIGSNSQVIEDISSNAKTTELANTNQPNRTGNRESVINAKELQSAAISQEVVIDSIESTLVELEIAALEEKLAALEGSQQVVESKESLALVLAIADQTALKLGGSKELVSEDMKYILDTFPESRGAEIAAQFADSGN